MNRCPSCSAERDEDRNVCEECGHVFQDDGKHTVMGFPGLKAVLDAAPEEEVDANKQTLFGFPAQKFGMGTADGDEAATEDEKPTDDPDTEDDSGDQTAIMSDPRGTIAGFNVQDHAFPNVEVSELEEDSDSSATMLGVPMIGGEVQTIEEERDAEVPANRGFGTMMGMSVTDLMNADANFEEIPGGSQANNPKATQFSMPAFNPDAYDEDESEAEEDDASTVSWNPNMVSLSKMDSPKKKAVLAKLRQEKPKLSRETDARGLPSLKGTKKPLPKPGQLGAKLGLSVPKPKGLIAKRDEVTTPHEFPEDATRLQPSGMAAKSSNSDPSTEATGVLKRAGSTRRQPNDANSQSGGIAGAYIVPKADLTTDNLSEEDDDDAPTEMIQAPSFLDTASQAMALDTEAEDDDLAYAETGIVPGNIADRVLADVRAEEELKEIDASAIEPVEIGKKLDPWASASSDDLSIQDQIASTQERDVPPHVVQQISQQSTRVSPVLSQQEAFKDTIQPYPQAAPVQQHIQQVPTRTVAPTHIGEVSEDDEKLVNIIQTVFGVLSAFVTFIVVVWAYQHPPSSKIGYVPLIVSALVAAGLALGAMAPIKSGTKSIVFGGAAFIIGSMGLAGVLTGIAAWWVLLFSAAFGVIGSAFPIIAKKVL